MKLDRLVLSIVLLAMAALAVPVAAQNGFPATHLSRLLSRNIPDSNAAWGIAVFDLDRTGSSARFRITVSRSRSPIVSYSLIRAHRGGSPATLLSLPAASGSLTAQGMLTNIPPAVFDALDSGLLSIRIATVDYPDGFVSGAIQEASNMVTFRFNSGEITPVLPDTVTGTALLTGILDSESRRFAYTLWWEGMHVAETGIEFHRGMPGENGPLLHAVAPVAADSLLITTWNGIAPEDIDAFRAGNIYAVVTTADYPAGQIRGQLTPITLLTCAIEPQQVVPPVVGSSGNGTGYLYIAGSPASGFVLYSLSAVAGTNDTIDSAHIHRGAFGTNGPVVAPLDVNRYAIWEYDRDLAVFPFDSATRADLSSGNGYLDFHTASFPDGEVRGQLVPAASALDRPVSSVREDPTMTRRTIGAYFDARMNSIRLESMDPVAGGDISVVIHTLEGAYAGTFHPASIDDEIPAGSLSTGLHIARIAIDGRTVGICRIMIVR